MARPMLGDIELQQVQKIEVEEDQVWVQHDVPTLEGDFFQGLGRRAGRVTLTGVLTGPEVGDGLQELRHKFRAAAPVPFVADITTATRVDQVLIEEMGVRELAGKPERFEYALTLREYIPATEPERPPPPPPPPPPPSVDTGTLIVEVIVEGVPGFDHSQTTVAVEGPQEDGTSLSRTLSNRADNIWTENEFPPGTYTVTAVATEPEEMSGSASATVRTGQTEHVKIKLRPGQKIAKAFMIHFWFDKAFIEPCMRAVMRQVAKYAKTHEKEKLVIVGHTDESGNDNYNQALSERRARSAYAFLTYRVDPAAKAAAIADWDQLRRQRTTDLHDRWGTREYQYMLQDLGYYPGNVDGNHGSMTDNAVRNFQGDKGLTVDGVVGDDTWAALIEAYMDLNEESLKVPKSQFLPNCEGEILKWLGCGEKMKVPSTPPRPETPEAPSPPPPRPTCGDPAWRPNRRTEFLFVKDDKLPCKVPEPVTFRLPQGNSVGSNWCLGPGSASQRCCFITRDSNQRDRWLVQPAEPGTITVQGSIRYENGNPLADTKYVLIAPDGLFMDGENICKRPGKGKPIPGRTDANGRFAYTKPTGVGIYTLEVELPSGAHVAYAATDPPATARGSVVCKRLHQGDKNFDAIVRPGPVSQVAVNPTITLASPVVVVKKPYTNPARQAVTLGVSAPLSGSGTFTRSNPAIKFFTAAVGGSEIGFDGTDNVFTGAQLSTGVQLFAEGASPSAALDDVQLTLTLSATGLLVGSPATATMTSVELMLDIFMSRTAAGVDPAPLTQPPDSPPAAGTTARDKWYGGRFVHVQDPPGNHHGRALLIVRQVQPAAFSGDLTLRQIAVGGINITGLDNKVQVFDNEAGGIAKANPHEFNASTIPAAGLRFWVEGQNVSAALRDAGFQLGIKDVEHDGDRCAMTGVQFSNIAADVPSTPANTPRLAPASIVNTPVARHNLTVTNFDENFAPNTALVLVENSVLATNQVNLSVQVAPAGVPVSWSVQRDTRPAPDGDHLDIITMSPNPVPGVTPDAANQLRATLRANAVGTFHIRPFVDCNGNNSFDHNDPLSGNRIDREPFIIMNLVLIRVQGFGNNSRVVHNRVVTNPAPPTIAGFDIDTGITGNPFASPAVAAVHNDATVRVTGGGASGRRGLDRLMAGWINNELPVGTSITVPPGEDVVAEYRDTTGPGPPRIHRRTSIWTPPTIAPPGVLNWPATVAASGGNQVFVPGPGPAPVLVSGPVLDASPFGSEGTGGNTPVGTEGAVGPPVNPAVGPGPPPQPGVIKNPDPGGVGERWQVHMWDSPGDFCPGAHGSFPGTLSAYRFNLDFRTDLCFWTNVTGVPGATPDAACRLYSTAQTNTWTIRFDVAFNAATGAAILGTNNIIRVRDAQEKRLAAPVRSSRLETRGPISLRLLGTDART